MITTSRSICSSFSRTLIICGLLAVLAACSTLRLSYSQGPTLAYWWLDRYVDFDQNQSTRVRRALNDWFDWHRSAQLPEIGQLVARVRADAAAPVSAGQVCRWGDDISAHLQRAYEQAVPAIAELVPTLRPEQLKQIERRYAKSNRDYANDFLQPDREARLNAAVKRAVERAEDYYGPLGEAQLALLGRRIAASPFDAQVSFAERRARQQDILAGLRRWTGEKMSPEAIRAELLQLGQQMRQSSREPYRLYQQRMFDHNCALIAELHNSASAEQRQRLARKLGAWESDIRSLVADAG